MNKLVKVLERVLSAIKLTDAALGTARHRYERQHTRALKRHDKKIKARERADQLRTERKPKKAANKDARAAVLASSEQKARAASRVILGDVKRLNQKAKGLAVREDELEAKIKRLNKPKVKGNKVTGGTEEERLQVALLTAAAKCANGSRRNFYSMAGVWDIDHALTGEQYGDRSDCSQFGAAIYNACGLAIPGTWTGDQEQKGRAVTREYARNNAGCAVLYGSRGHTHHVEWSVGDGSEHTVGHGSAPVDMGTFDLLSGPVQFRAYD